MLSYSVSHRAYNTRMVGSFTRKLPTRPLRRLTKHERNERRFALWQSLVHDRAYKTTFIYIFTPHGGLKYINNDLSHALRRNGRKGQPFLLRKEST